MPPKTLVCFSHLRWNFVWQRPQHLLSRAADEFDVVFIEEPEYRTGIAPHLSVNRSAAGVRVAVPQLPAGSSGSVATRMQSSLLKNSLLPSKSSELVLWYYTPMALPISEHLRARAVVYDNMDELSAFKGASPRLLTLERRLFERADVVFVGGQSLYEAKKQRHSNIHCFPSSIDARHFHKARSGATDPDDQRDIGHPRLGFFGVVDERFDAKLLARTADLRPDWQFIVIGPVVKIDAAELPRRHNIHWLGAKNYSDLPSYLSGWDLGFMPFALNESTRFISPTKTPEFLAAGLPVISTPVRDVVRPYGELGHVEIAGDSTAVMAAAERLMARPRQTWLAKVDDFLRGNSWDLTWARMRAEIDKVLERRSTSSHRPTIEKTETARV